jgi:uncharacterized protein YecT (DUF1311 family)
MRPALLALILATCLPTVGLAADDDPAETACRQKESDNDIAGCLQRLTGQWDKRLNAAYQTTLKASDDEAQKSALLRAERAWLAFRTANCDWYGTHQGTIRTVYAANCMLDMTRGRAVELEQALKP